MDARLRQKLSREVRLAGGKFALRMGMSGALTPRYIPLSNMTMELLLSHPRLI